jgi:hypothetical protein|tara:strand:- start:121 stop:567 length:447 start_codon:yes stop_codon:yes gene_type:complete
MTLFLVFIINTFLVLATIVIHYEVLFQLSKRLSLTKKITPSYKVLICVFTIFLAHVVEIWLFGLGYYFSSQLDGIGNLFGKTANHGIILDYVYLSFVTYTTLGYGDLVASGYLRYLTGVEALVGLILITWSASFLFIEMGKYWRVKKR